MKIRVKQFELIISNWFPAVLPLLFAVGCLNEYAVAMASVALHELGHMAVAKLRGCSVKGMRITPVGFNATIDEWNCSKRSLILVYFSGPAVNLVIAAVLFFSCFLIPWDRKAAGNIVFLNLCLAVFNLMPALPLDGGKIMFEAVSGCFGIGAAVKASKRAALFLSVVFILAGLWQLFRASGNFTLLVIGLFVLVSLADNRMEAGFMNIRQIIYRRSRLMKKGIYPARELVVMKRMQLGECVKHMDYDRIHLINVMDDDMTLIARFTESEIIEAMLANASDLSFEELVRLSKEGKHRRSPLPGNEGE